MYRSGSKSSSLDDPQIGFPLVECWNPITNVATLAAEVNKKRVLCRISADVLAKRFQAPADQPMQAVAENRPVLHAAARTLIENGAYEQDGSIVIRQGDL